MMRFTVALLLSLVGFNSFACGDEQGHGRLGERYYMAMSPEAQERFVGKLHTLKKGMPSGKVIRVLGRPDGNNVLRNKRGDFVTRTYVYYLKRWKKDSVDGTHDCYVSIYFDQRGALTGYQELGAPDMRQYGLN